MLLTVSSRRTQRNQVFFIRTKFFCTIHHHHHHHYHPSKICYNYLTTTTTFPKLHSSKNDISSTRSITSISSSSSLLLSEKLRRCLFSVPGCVPKMIQKSKTLGADSVVLDLEDGVPYNQKEYARQLVYETLQEPMIQSNTNNESNNSSSSSCKLFGRSEVCVRINSLDAPNDMAVQDLEQILQCSRLETIVVPKVEHPDAIEFVQSIIQKNHAKPNDNAQPPIRILAAIESAMGMLNLRDIAKIATRNTDTPTSCLDGLIFASEDYCANVEMIRTVPDATELLFARSLLVTTAKAYNLQAIDMVQIHDIHNTTALRQECIQGRQMGFTGKQAIHPIQIATIHDTFSPSTKDIVFAKKCMQLFHGAPLVIDGVVVDTPVYKWAMKILHRAHAAGMDDPMDHQEQQE